MVFYWSTEPGYVATPATMVQAAITVLNDLHSLPKRSVWLCVVLCANRSVFLSVVLLCVTLSGPSLRYAANSLFRFRCSFWLAVTTDPTETDIIGNSFELVKVEHHTTVKPSIHRCGLVFRWQRGAVWWSLTIFPCMSCRKSRFPPCVLLYGSVCFLLSRGGVYTPAAAFSNTRLIERLNTHGIKFSVRSYP